MGRIASSSGGARIAGLLVPLFALHGARSWGIGEIGDLPKLAAWAARAGHGLLQLLPVFEMAPGERSPYGALSAFALDPIYVALDAVEDFVTAGGEGALAARERSRLARLRAGSAIDYDGVRRVKERALALAFRHFLATEWRGGSARAAALRDFCAAERDWLEPYARFRAALAGPATGVRARERATLFRQYVQWIAAEQWTAARRAAAAASVRLAGDVPFTVAPTSADVAAHPDAFDVESELGAPPDAFNPAGQRWGLPRCRWEAGAAWLAARSGRIAALFDAVRLDHVVGFYRQYVFTPAGAARYEPADERAQVALGERLLGVAREAAGDVELMGEDLGVVPPFVRASLHRLDLPGYRVLRWETDAGVFRDPRAYPARSVATSGTHDTSALATWWSDELDTAGRRALAAVPPFAALRGAGATWTPAVHAALLAGLYAAGSDLLVLPVIDAYGGRDRINAPGTVSRANWSYRLPWRVEDLDGDAARSVADHLRARATEHGRA